MSDKQALGPRSTTTPRPNPDLKEPTGLGVLRKPFPPHQISKLPKPTKKQTEEVRADFKKGIRCQVCGAWHHPDVVHLDYVGHAALTDRLLDADPAWQWEPLATTAEGLPRFDETGGLWIKLTVCGVSRLGYGHAVRKEQMDPGSREKEVIGDALRNAAMRFGAALELWHKGQLHDDDEPEQEKKKFPSPVTSALEGETFTPEQTAQIHRIANSLIDLCTLESEGDDSGYKIWELMEPLDNGEKLLLWQILQPHSKVRSRIKAVVLERQKAAA